MNRASHGSFCGKNGKFRVEVRPSAFFISSFFMREPDFFRQLFYSPPGRRRGRGRFHRLYFRYLEHPPHRPWPSHGIHDGGRAPFRLFGPPGGRYLHDFIFPFQKIHGDRGYFLSAGAACWLNPVTCLLFIWFSALTALLFSAYFLLTGKWNRKSPVRFGPFMALGGILAYGMEIWLPLPPGLPFG